MTVERETLVEFGVPLAAALVFILAIALVGVLFGGEELSGAGALAMIVVIVAFVIGMAVVGFVRGGEDD